MRRMLTLAAALCALAAVSGVAAPSAFAGCTAVAGASSFDPARGAIATHHGITCTTNNGSDYQLRMYMQADNGGWHTTTPKVVKVPDYASPPDNYRDTTPVVYWQCNTTYVPTAANYVRSKSVIENMVTHTLSVLYGPALLIPSGCP